MYGFKTLVNGLANKILFVEDKVDENELTKDKALKVLIEAGAVEPLSDSSGFIYTDKNGMIYTL